MTDRTAVLVAAAAAAGAWHPSRPAMAVGVMLLIAAVRWRRTALVCLAAGLLTSGLAQRSLDGLDGLVEATVVGDATLLGDPTPSFGGLRVDVRLGHRRLEARADGVAAAALEERLAGEVVRVRGTVEPVSDQPWLTARHVSGRLDVLVVQGWRPGDPSTRVANGLRRTLEAGAQPLRHRQHSLFTGLVIGDDRHQPTDLADDFLGAGLTHLLAVSGQNVAFVLALAGPVLRRLRLWPRLLVTVAVIGLFGVMTRFEPSVLRASAMAVLAATLAMAGTPISRVRVIALATAVLLVVDPLLVRSVGFQLSVSAALAIVVAAPRIAQVIPGPAGVRDALGVTVAAQLGVAPVLLATFGPIPVAALPANLLAVPVAGLVMVWGLTAGLVAGAAGEPVASVLHGPTGAALHWLEVVARGAARAPLGELQLGHVVALGLGLGVAVVAGERTVLRRTGLALAGLGVAVAVVVAQAPPPLRASLVPGVVRWHGRHTDVVVLGGVGGRSTLAAPAVLQALRRAGVDAIDLLVVADPSVPAAVVDDVVRGHPTAVVVADGAALLDAPRGTVVRLPPEGAVVDLGSLTVRLVVVPDRLVVDAVPRGP